MALQRLSREVVTGADMVHLDLRVREMVWYIRPWWQRAVLRLFGYGP